MWLITLLHMIGIFLSMIFSEQNMQWSLMSKYVGVPVRNCGAYFLFSSQFHSLNFYHAFMGVVLGTLSMNGGDDSTNILCWSPSLVGCLPTQASYNPYHQQLQHQLNPTSRSIIIQTTWNDKQKYLLQSPLPTWPPSWFWRILFV